MTYQPHPNTSDNVQILRAKWHDYHAPGCYLLTMVTEEREKSLGTLEGESEETAAIRLSETGRVLEDAVLHDIETQFPEVEVIKHIVMEDHCHIAIRVKSPMQKHLGAIIGMLKTCTTKAYLNERSLREQRLCLTLPASIRDRQRQLQRLNALQAWLANGAAEPPKTKQYEIALAISRAIAAKQAAAGSSLSGVVPAGGDLSGVVPAGGDLSGVVPAGGDLSGVVPASSAACVPCGSATRCAALLPAVPVAYVRPLWAKGYHDRIVRQMGQVAKQKVYIDRNPARLWLKRHSDSAFTKVRDIRHDIPFPLAQQLKDFAVYWDQRRSVYHSPYSHRYDGKLYSESYVELVQKFLRRRIIKPAVAEPHGTEAAGAHLLGTEATATCAPGLSSASVPCGSATTVAPSALASTSAAPSACCQAFLQLRSCGNLSLLQSPRPLVRVRISRSVTEEQFRDEVSRILSLCEREGTIAISPFRSWSEKAMLHILRMNGYDHIIIHGEAMWEGWKPQDGSTTDHKQTLPQWFLDHYHPMLTNSPVNGDMDEVYAGHCIFLAPWYDRPRGEKAGKADCELMNELCKIMESEY